LSTYLIHWRMESASKRETPVLLARAIAPLV
jgi:hypothetical protein